MKLEPCGVAYDKHSLCTVIKGHDGPHRSYIRSLDTGKIQAVLEWWDKRR